MNNMRKYRRAETSAQLKKMREQYLVNEYTMANDYLHVSVYSMTLKEINKKDNVVTVKVDEEQKFIVICAESIREIVEAQLQSSNV